MFSLFLATKMFLNDADPRLGKKLVFQDEFRRDGLPDKKNWLYEEGKVRNNEAQYYTKSRKENARVENHQLVIEAIKESYKDSSYTSAALESKQSWNHGYVEVSAKVPTGRGTWPAIWLLGQGIREKGDKYIDWPLCGEIDMMENVGFDPLMMHFSIHTKDRYWVKQNGVTSALKVENAWQEFHVYGFEWNAENMTFYFDHKPVLTFANPHKGVEAWPFDKPMFIILNLAIGGMWGGQQGIDDSIFPSRMLVKYVKVYH